jgi:hypothetical protein
VILFAASLLSWRAKRLDWRIDAVGRLLEREA